MIDGPSTSSHQTDSPLGLPMLDYPRRSSDHRIVTIAIQRFKELADPEGDGQQYYRLWCWAATLGMIVRYHGIPLHQEHIVKRIYPDLRDARATVAQIMTLPTTMWTPPPNQVPHSVTMQPIEKTALLEELSADRPVMVVLKKEDSFNYHAYVLAGVILNSRDGRERPETAIVVNPDAHDHAWETLPWNNLLDRYSVGLAVRVTKLVLHGEATHHTAYSSSHRHHASSSCTSRTGDIACPSPPKSAARDGSTAKE